MATSTGDLDVNSTFLMKRRLLIPGVGLILLLSLGAAFLVRKSFLPRPHLAFGADRLLYYSTNFPRVAVLQVTNVSSQTLDVFPLYSVQTKVDVENPFRSQAGELGRKWKPGEYRTVHVVLRNVSGSVWRVGLWYTEVQPRWKETLQLWLSKLGWEGRQKKIFQFSDWFDANSIPTVTNTPEAPPGGRERPLLGWEVEQVIPRLDPELPPTRERRLAAP